MRIICPTSQEGQAFSFDRGRLKDRRLCRLLSQAKKTLKHFSAVIRLQRHLAV